jgi:surfactin synthase thioesterase subunit
MTGTSDRWIGPGWRAGGVAEGIMFCLPHAGAGASVYRQWPPAFVPRVAVCPIQLPGRENRLGEEPAFAIAEIAAAVERCADRPYSIYGHSMGAWIGFELTRELCRRGVPPPRRLFAGAADPPDVSDGYASRLADLADGDLLIELAHLGGIDARVLEQPELVALVLPTIRADLRWLADRRHLPGPALDVPVVAVAGDADPIVPPEAMRGWARHTRAGFSLHVLPGGHFAPHENLPVLAALVDAGAWVSACAPPT